MTSDDTPGPGRAGTATPVVGSVADEAARLVELLAARGWSAAPAPDQPTDPPPRPDQAADEPPAPSGADGTARADDEPHACTCGGTTPSACRVCPLCQLIAFVQRVEPDTIERVADVVGLAATALHDLATAQRARRERSAEDA